MLKVMSNFEVPLSTLMDSRLRPANCCASTGAFCKANMT